MWSDLIWSTLLSASLTCSSHGSGIVLTHNVSKCSVWYGSGGTPQNLGKITQFFGVIIALMAIGIGAFAGNTYNDGAAPVDYQVPEPPRFDLGI